MMKSHNFIHNSNCPAKDGCGFYQKDKMNKEDVFYYIDHCLKFGSGCGLKKHYDKTHPSRKELPKNLEGKI